jgi:monoamine oxidase
MLGAYTFSDEIGEKFARMTPAQRIAAAIQQGEKLHPGYGNYVESAVTIPWHRMNHMLGCSARWDDDVRAQWFSRLQAPVGGHYLIGDQLSYHSGWQEGAIHSAYHALADIDQRVRGQATQVVSS